LISFFRRPTISKGNRLAREIFALFLVFCGAVLLLSLISYSQADPSFNHAVSGRSGFDNWAGLAGAYLSGLLVDIFGLSAFLFPVAVFVSAARHYLKAGDILWWRWVGLTLLGMCIASFTSAIHIGIGDITGGGLIGHELSRLGQRYLGTAGAVILWIFAFLVSVQLAVGFTWVALFAVLTEAAGSFSLPEGLKKRSFRSARSKALPQADLIVMAQKEPEERPRGVAIARTRRAAAALRNFWHIFFPVEKQSRPEARTAFARLESDTEDDSPSESSASASPLPAENSGAEISADGNSAQFYIGPEKDEPAPLAELQPETAPSQGTAGRTSCGAGQRPRRKVKLPSASMLETPKGIDKKTPKAVLESKGQTLVSCLADFGIQGELVRITPGPVVTMFEIRPAAGVKVSRIANLSDDLALALKAIAVRIQAPIPGKDTVGVEIPNEDRETVSLKELLGSEPFGKAESYLTMAIGKDISGIPTVADLAKMPHLLVAGATGAGKSVCINSILMSFLFKARPEEVQLLLVDPKRIELAVYADLPHLVHPVVTDMAHAKNALDWAVHEMDKRYEAMARLGVRNVTGYNQKIESFGDAVPAEFCDLEKLPYLVIIIDELADLMLTAAKEVETSIVRLAQLARAAGIHMILATQRPSVDVVTGLIKANFPCRISFQVTSKHDSRTILDTVGAEHLLGRGDMLFKPGGGRLQRMHGAFVSDEDVAAVVEYWKERQAPSYRVDFSEWGSPSADDSGINGGAGDSLGDDPVYAEAVQFVMSQGKASISLIQRRFRIGFNRAARYVEQMEQDGIIGPADGSKPRTVIGAREN
jgi:S-DNA-T family DNA segregation ATPase FtsK/SpoIIIE